MRTWQHGTCIGDGPASKTDEQIVARRFALYAETHPAHRFPRSMDSSLNEIMVHKISAPEEHKKQLGRATARPSWGPASTTDEWVVAKRFAPWADTQTCSGAQLSTQLGSTAESTAGGTAQKFGVATDSE